MKKLFFLLLILCSCETTQSQTTRMRYYNEKGVYEGYSVDSGDRVRYYDSKGIYKGYSTKK